MIIETDKVVVRGAPFNKAKKVLILLHGRGDRASSFVNFSENLNISKDEFAIVALQAENNTWYPYSFLKPLDENEPYLSNSLNDITKLLHDMYALGFNSEDIYFLGFSQGACLSLEFCTRNAKRYGGIIAFTGGLLGDELNLKNYKGDFKSTLIFIGSSDKDPHVPEKRIEESEKILREMGANVQKKIYVGMGHTINKNELDHADVILNN